MLWFVVNGRNGTRTCDLHDVNVTLATKSSLKLLGERLIRPAFLFS